MKTFKEWKLSSKLAAGFGFSLAVMAVITVISYVRISAVQEAVDDLTRIHIELSSLSHELDTVVADQELAATKFALHGDKELVAEYQQLQKKADEVQAELKKIVNADPDLVQKGWPQQEAAIEGLHDAFSDACSNMISCVQEKQSREKQDKAADDVEAKSKAVMEKIDKFLETNAQETGTVSKTADDAADATKTILPIAGLVGILGTLALSILIGRSITRPIQKIIDALSSGSNQVTAASEQVAAASQQMAEGSSEQASSLEETSSSLEEMSSMTRQTADNANQANSGAKQATSQAHEGVRAMEQMSQVMDRIRQSATETAKIIKTIDEIAFQTNLLALNAAVEAARAGEAGKGFAVVAEEVRNLARRSAEAAKSTADLIEGSQKNAEAGVTATAEVGKNLQLIQDSASKVAVLVDEIAAATKEQSQGIEQVNTAVAEMDKVIQANAASAEESAGAAEELSGQAQELNSMVADLTALITGVRREANIEAVVVNNVKPGRKALPARG